MIFIFLKYNKGSSAIHPSHTSSCHPVRGIYRPEENGRGLFFMQRFDDYPQEEATAFFSY